MQNKSIGLNETEIQKLEEFFQKKSRKKNLSPYTKMNYMTALKSFKRFLNEELDKESIFESSISDFDTFIDWVMKNYPRLTASFYSRQTRGFLLFVFPELKTQYLDIQLPAWKREKLKAELLIKPEEIIALIEKGAKNHRDRALISFLADTGVRRSELLYIQLKHIKDEGTHIEVFIPVSKTEWGRRIVYVRTAAGYLREWINIHPKKDDPNTYLFCSLLKPHGKLHPTRIGAILKEAAQDAGIRVGAGKREGIFTHLFRHTRTTEDMTKFSTEVVKKLRGDSERSRVHEDYTHLVNPHVSKAWKKEHGIEINDKEEQDLFEPILCSRCNFQNVPTAVICSQCGLALSDEYIFKHKEEENTELKEIYEFIKTNKELIEKIPEMAKTMQLLKSLLPTSD